MGFLVILGWILLPIVIILVLRGIRVIYQYERGVVFQLGKYIGTREPGLTFVIPIIQTMRKVDMRIKTADIPRQEVMTRDNIPMLVNAVVYFKVVDPEAVIIRSRTMPSPCGSTRRQRSATSSATRRWTSC